MNAPSRRVEKQAPQTRRAASNGKNDGTRPYVAVVMANAASTKSDGFELRDDSSQDKQLPPGADSE